MCLGFRFTKAFSVCGQDTDLLSTNLISFCRQRLWASLWGGGWRGDHRGGGAAGGQWCWEPSEGDWTAEGGGPAASGPIAQHPQTATGTSTSQKGLGLFFKNRRSLNLILNWAVVTNEMKLLGSFSCLLPIDQHIETLKLDMHCTVLDGTSKSSEMWSQSFWIMCSHYMVRSILPDTVCVK